MKRPETESRLEYTLKQQLEQYVAEKEIAGASLLVRREGRTLSHFHCGYADVSKRIPVDERTIFRLASMTKPIAAIAAMILVEQGKWTLDDPVHDVLPAFRHMQTITIRDILTHSSGLGNGPEGERALQRCFGPDDTLEKRVTQFAGLPFAFQPGTKTEYSGLVAFDILGRMIEEITGMDLDTFMRQNIFDPLGMQDTGFRLSPEQQSRVARLYYAEDGHLQDVTDTDELFGRINPLPNGYMSASAGLFGTLNDYDKIVQLLAGEGTHDHVQLLQPETVRQMRTAASRHELERHPGIVWGLGMSVTRDPERAKSWHSPGTYGWSGAFGTHFLIDPVKRLQIVLMLNRSNIGGASSYISKQVEKLVYH